MADSKVNYQWIKGDRMGTVESFHREEEEGGINWTYFESGRRINSAVVNEFLIALPPGEVPMEMEISKDSKEIKAVSKPQPKKESAHSPIRSLLEKQKKTKKERLNIHFEIEVPTKEVYSILEETFGSEEMLQEVENMILERTDLSGVTKKIKEEIQKFIKKNYESDSK